MEERYAGHKFCIEDQGLHYSLLEKQIAVLKVAVSICNATVFVKDLKQSAYHYISYLPQALCGYTKEETLALLKEGSSKFLSKDDLKFICDIEPIMFEFLAELEPQRRKHAVLCLAHQFIHKDGFLYPVYLKLTPFVFDDEKNVWMLLGRINLAPKYFKRFFFIEMCDTGERFDFDFCKSEMVGGSKPRLTKTQRKVLSFSSRGLLEKEISEELQVSVNTIKTHKRNILNVLQADNINDAYVLANMHSLL